MGLGRRKAVPTASLGEPGGGGGPCTAAPPPSVGPLEFVRKQDHPGSANRNCTLWLVGWTATPDGEEPVCPAVTVSFHVFHKPLREVLVLEVER